MKKWLLLFIFIPGISWSANVKLDVSGKVGRTPPTGKHAFITNASNNIVWTSSPSISPNIVTDYVAWEEWVNYRIAQFELHCPLNRSTNYYFDNTLGNDTTGNGSEASPFKTREKAIALSTTTGSENTAFHFKRGETWISTANWATTISNQTMRDYGTGPLPRFLCVSSTVLSDRWTQIAGQNVFTVPNLSTNTAYIWDVNDIFGEVKGLPYIRLNSSTTVLGTNYSFFMSSNTGLLYVNHAGSTPSVTGLTLQTIVSNSSNGIEINGDGSRIHAIEAMGYGMHKDNVGTQAQPFTTRVVGDEAVYLTDVRGFYSNTHVIALNNPSSSGGHWMCNGCVAGLGQVDPISDSVSMYNSYAANGGHETWIVNSEARGGALPEFSWSFGTDKTAGTCILSHTGGPSAGIGVLYNTRGSVLAGTRINVMSLWNNSETTQLDVFEGFPNFTVKNRIEPYPTGHRDLNLDRAFNTIYYGNRIYYKIFSGASGGLWNDDLIRSAYWMNNEFFIDMTDVGNQTYGFYNLPSVEVSSGTFINNTITSPFWTLTNGTTRYGMNFDNRLNGGVPGTGALSPDDRFFNNIISISTANVTGGGLGTVRINLALSNQSDLLKNNAYSGFFNYPGTEQGYDNTVAYKILPSPYDTLGTRLATLEGAGDATFMLSHDINGKRRMSNPPDIGSVDFSSVGSASQGPNRALSVVASDSLGGSPWVSTTTGASFEDDIFASITNDSSYLLLISSFGFSVPSDATITGVEARCKKWADSSGVLDNVFNLNVPISGLVGNSQNSSVPWHLVENEYITYGGPGNTWGASLTPSDVNDSAFGIGLTVLSFTATAKLDVCDMKVYFSQ